MHDDVHGTAVVGARRDHGRLPRSSAARLERPVVGQIGLGAAGFGIARLAQRRRGAKARARHRSGPARPDPRRRERHRDRRLRDRHGEADIVVATTGRPGLIGPEMVREGQVVLALTNPEPEIEPQAALRAGAAFAADGASVNNVLALPGHLPRRARPAAPGRSRPG